MRNLQNLKGASILSKKEQVHIFGGDQVFDGGCLGSCAPCKKNGDCCSTVCAVDQPGCGGGKKCLR